MEVWDADAYRRHGAFVPGLAGEVLAWLDARPGERILDLGCGDGALTEKLAAGGARATGVDNAPSMVTAARARGLAIALAGAETLPFPAASFDAVFSNAALHWMRDHDAVIAEVHRVLAPGGRFAAEMGGHGNIAALRVAFTAVLDRHGFGDRPGDSNYYPTPEEFRRRLERHGFAVERMLLVPRPTPLDAAGMSGWLRTFRRGVLETLPEDLRETVVLETAALLEPVLRDAAGQWTADYVRLRFLARMAPARKRPSREKRGRPRPQETA